MAEQCYECGVPHCGNHVQPQGNTECPHCRIEKLERELNELKYVAPHERNSSTQQFKGECLRGRDRIKELEQRLHASEDAVLMQSLFTKVAELERTIANNALLEPLQVRRLKRERDEANALLKKLEWGSTYGASAGHCGICNQTHHTPADCRLAAHLNPHSDLGLEGQRYEANDGD